MDKQQARERIEAIERAQEEMSNEVQALRAIIEAPERAPSLLTKPIPGSSVEYFGLRWSPTDALEPRQCNANSYEAYVYAHGSIFQTRALAKAYADAIETMLLLRHQPGTKGEERNWTIAVNTTLNVVRVENGWTPRITLMFIVPMFVSRETAQVAIDTIGTERILRMFKTLNGIDE